jgi:hypothetical protein
MQFFPADVQLDPAKRHEKRSSVLPAAAASPWHGLRTLVRSMRIVCAWCYREGQPGYLGEREPLDNPEPTHGICDRHRAAVLESLPSQSFPDAELLIVVRRGNLALYEDIVRMLTGLARVAVIVDRRVADRRAAPAEGPRERRSLSTRRLREVAGPSSGDLTLVRFTPVAAEAEEVEAEER